MEKYGSDIPYNMKEKDLSVLSMWYSHSLSLIIDSYHHKNCIDFNNTIAFADYC